MLIAIGASFAMRHPRLGRHSLPLPYHLTMTTPVSPNYHHLSRCATSRMNRHAGHPFPVHKRSEAREIMIPHHLYLLKKENFLVIELSSYRTLPHIGRDTAKTRRDVPALMSCPPEKDPNRMIAELLSPVHKRSVAREIMIPHRLYLSKKEIFLAIELSSYHTLPHT